MKTTHDKIISDLKHLLAICNDGKEGYKKAVEELDSDELKTLMTMYSIQRAEFEMQLEKAIHQLGEDADNDKGGPVGMLHRVWMDIKTAFTKNDDLAILKACETGEEAAIKAYDEVLQNPDLSPETVTVVASQRTGIYDCLGNIRNLKEQYARG